MAGQISEGNKEFFKLLQQLSTDYRVNTGLLQEFRRDLSDINARARKGRELN
jgi:ribosomal protein L29